MPLSKTTAHTLDYLAYEVLTELILFSKSAEHLECFKHLRSRFSNDVESLLCQEPQSVQLLSPRIHLPIWRVRFLLVSGVLLRDCHLCSLANYDPQWPLGLQTNPSLAFFVHHYVKEDYRVRKLIFDERPKEWPPNNLCSLLTGLFWSSNFIFTRSCSSSEQPLVQSCCLSDQQLCDIIDFLLNMLHDSPKPDCDSDEIILRQLSALRFELQYFRAQRLPQSISTVSGVPICSDLRQFLSTTWDQLVLALSGSLPSVDLRGLMCFFKILLNYATIRERLQDDQICQFLSILQRVPLSLHGKPITNGQIGDVCRPFVCANESNRVIDNEGTGRSTSPFKHIRLMHLNHLELLGSLFRFASKVGDSELIIQLQTALTNKTSQVSCGDTVESVEWYCTLVKVIRRAFFSISPVEFCATEEAYAVFVSFLVDTLREALRSRLGRGSSLPNVVHLIYLMKSYCELTDCVCLLVERVKSKQLDRRWPVIGCHLDQLCKTVWAVCTSRYSGLLVGLQFFAGECLHAWIKVSPLLISFFLVVHFSVSVSYIQHKSPNPLKGSKPDLPTSPISDCNFHAQASCHPVKLTLRKHWTQLSL